MDIVWVHTKFLGCALDAGVSMKAGYWVCLPWAVSPPTAVCLACKQALMPAFCFWGLCRAPVPIKSLAAIYGKGIKTPKMMN